MTPLLTLMHDTNVHLCALRAMRDNFKYDMERLGIEDAKVNERIERMRTKVDKIQEILDAYYVEMKKTQ